MYLVMFLGVEPLVSRSSCMAETTRAAILRGFAFLPFLLAAFVSFLAMSTLNR